MKHSLKTYNEFIVEEINTSKIKYAFKNLFKNFSGPFIELYNNLKSKWSKGMKIGEMKSEIIKDLDQVKKRIIEAYKNSDHSSWDTEVIDKELNKVKNNIDLEVFDTLNVKSFFWKIKQIINIGDPKYFEDDIEKLFQKYYKTLDDRISDAIDNLDKGEDEGDEKFDPIEGERSVLSRKQYKREKFKLQAELLKLQEWVKKENKRVCILFEGRDAAGKGSNIKRFKEYLNPDSYRVVALGIPTEWESKHWFERYEKHLPQPGEIVFFDRSWYNRAVVEPTMGYSTDEQYKHFMDNVNEWENSMIEDGVILIKFWFSIEKEKQLQRFEIRKQSPLKYWKFSPNDKRSMSKWDVMTKYKEQMFEKTSTDKSPWVIIDSNDKKVARLNAMRYVISKIDYDGKDESIKPYPEVVKVLD